MSRFKVVTVRRANQPDHWGVQILAGYVDYKPSYQLVRKFWRKSDAVAYAALANLGLDAEGAVVEAKP